MAKDINPMDAVMDRVALAHRQRIQDARKTRGVQQGRQPQTRGEALAATEKMTPTQRRQMLEQQGPSGVLQLLGGG